MSSRPYDPLKDTLDQLAAMDKAQELFLPVHGHVLLYPEELAIINHPPFQRLRRVRQLGLAHMVFPGATHTRFEHCVGAVHVAQMIIDHVNDNYRRKHATKATAGWNYVGVNYPSARFIRLGALLHDIGHLPFGHTLEDELHHLKAHDGNERLALVAGRNSEQYEIDRCLVRDADRPPLGWSLEGLVDFLYKPFAQQMEIPAGAFVLLTHIVCREPRIDEDEKKKWMAIHAKLAEHVDLAVCKDIVGNTICADFLDYLHRDWLHIGKPLYNDKRLYQYMEVRDRNNVSSTAHEGARFVINVGPREKVRHDALTDILELLNARYKLAETVLFHRTKLALTGLLDRCLLELRELYLLSEIDGTQLTLSLERLLLESSDDGLIGVLKKLSRGGTSQTRKRSKAPSRQRDALSKASSGKLKTSTGT